MNSQSSDGALRNKQMQKCKKWELFFFKPELNLCPGKPLCCIKAQRQCLEVGQQCFEWLWRRPKPLFVDLLYFGYGLNKDFSTKHLAQPPESHVVLSGGSLCLPRGWIWSWPPHRWADGVGVEGVEWGGGFFPAVLQGSLEVSQGGGGTTFPPQADIHPTPLTRREHVTTCATNVHLRKNLMALYPLFFQSLSGR